MNIIYLHRLISLQQLIAGDSERCEFTLVLIELHQISNYARDMYFSSHGMKILLLIEASSGQHNDAFMDLI